MKNDYLFVVIIIAIFSIFGCQQEDSEDLKGSSISTIYPTYLDIGADLDKTEISNLSLEEENIYFEARERFGSIVDYKDQQFYLIHSDYKELNISESLFKHFEKIMDRSNNAISVLAKEQIGKVKVNSLIANNVRLKTRREVGGAGGCGGFERTWYGFDVYLSNSDLLLITTGASIIGVIATYIPEPALSKAVGAACGITAALASYGASTCPNGVIISFVYPVPVPSGCVPFSVSKQ